MILALGLLLQATVSQPPKTLTVKRGTTESPVAIMTSSGRAVLRADQLANALGGILVSGRNGRFALSLPHGRIDLIQGIPFARIDSSIVPLGSAPEQSGPFTLLPMQVATDLVPRFGGGFFYDAALSELRAFGTVIQHPVLPESGSIASRVRPSSTTTPTTVTPPLPLARPSRRLVVVDAGHGGPDHGMSGPIGEAHWFVEKDVTLSVARKLADALRSDGMDVLMTRTTDTLIALSDRGRIANRNHGDVFVSIHVNAPGVSNSAGARERGFETYFLAEAKTEDERRVERMENESVRFETGANAPKGDPLSFIITDMAQNEHLREASDLAATIQEGMKGVHPGPSRGVQQANFAVLRGSYMPAVLVEIGFGTNPSEAAYLSDSDNQTTLARNIAGSILTYLASYDSRVGGTR